MTTSTIEANRSVVSRIGALVPMGRSCWQAFGAGILRSAGFPVEGLALLACPELGGIAHQYLNGDVDESVYRDAFTRERLRLSHRITDLFRREDFLSALTWQNRNVLTHGMGGLLTPSGRLSSHRRREEETAALYWQRYCGKAETIGFFGPFAWVPVGAPGVALGFSPSDELIEDMWVCMEAWAVEQLGDAFAEAGGRWWFPPQRRPDQGVDAGSGELVLPGRANLRVPPRDMRVLRLVDGRRNGPDILAMLARGPDGSLWDRTLVEKILNKYVHRRFLTWTAATPISPIALPLLHERIRRIEDEELRSGFETVLAGITDRLHGLETAVDHQELADRLADFDRYYASVTDGPTHRANGKAYAARTTVYMDATRPCTASIGESLLTRISDPMDLVLRSADWFGEQLCRTFEDSLTGSIISTMDERNAQTTLADVWGSSLQLLWGEAGENPLGAVRGELSRRWAAVLGGIDPGSTRVRLESDRIRPLVDELFPPTDPPVPAMSVHSPDIQVIARSADAIEAGDYQVVLGELHACLSTLEIPAVERSAGPTTNLLVRDSINKTMGTQRVVPLFPDGWRRNTGRMKPARIGTEETGIGFTSAVATNPGQVIPASRISLKRIPGGIIGTTPEGRILTLREIWGVPLSILCADAFKIGLPGDHAPRLSINDLILFRETWHSSLDDLVPAKHGDAAMDFARVQKWRDARSLPQRAFAKFQNETKPIYIDFTSPVLTASFVRMARREISRGTTSVIITECLPAPEDNWLCDGAGQHYVSEFRFQVTRNAPSAFAASAKE